MITVYAQPDETIPKALNKAVEIASNATGSQPM
jgi:hypothetical protein